MVYAMACKNNGSEAPGTVEGFDSLPGGTNQKPFHVSGRAVKGSAFYLLLNLLSVRRPYRYAYRESLMRSHVFNPFQGRETVLTLKRQL